MIKILSLRGEQISSDGCLSNWPLGRRLKGGLEFSASLKISRIANTFSSQIEAQEKGRTHTLSHNHHVVIQSEYLQPPVADEDVHLEAGEDVEAEVQTDEAREVLQYSAPDQEMRAQYKVCNKLDSPDELQLIFPQGEMVQARQSNENLNSKMFSLQMYKVISFFHQLKLKELSDNRKG